MVIVSGSLRMGYMEGVRQVFIITGKWHTWEELAVERLGKLRIHECAAWQNQVCGVELGVLAELSIWKYIWSQNVSLSHEGGRQKVHSNRVVVFKLGLWEMEWKKMNAVFPHRRTLCTLAKFHHMCFSCACCAGAGGSMGTLEDRQFASWALVKYTTIY